jgi:hypothetical protein
MNRQTLLSVVLVLGLTTSCATNTRHRVLLEAECAAPVVAIEGHSGSSLRVEHDVCIRTYTAIDSTSKWLALAELHIAKLEATTLPKEQRKEWTEAINDWIVLIKENKN